MFNNLPRDCFQVLLAILACSVSHAADRPNVVLIMADDIGVEGIGCYGGTSYRTPAIDHLAKQGQRFVHAYAQPLCTNTRVQLMTGLYNNRNWRYFGVLDPQAKTIGHYMKAAGYSTCMAGKWQLQSYDPPSYPGSHLRRGKGMKASDAGFDEYSLFHAWHTEEKGSRYAEPTIYENGQLLEQIDDSYGPDHWVEFINDFISRKSGDDEPFFVYYAMALPHRPFVATPKSASWKDTQTRSEEDVRNFPDMVEYMDHCVGRVVKHIDAQGLAEDTLVIFYSDNGTHQKVTSQTTGGPVAGGKGRTTDAGTHVPLIVRWQGKIKPDAVNRNLVDSTDFLPTIVEAAGQRLPEKIDGISFYQQLFGNYEQVRPWVFCHYDPRPGWDKDQFRKIRFARDRQFKLYGNGKLFDVTNDQLEQTPIPDDKDTKQSLKARQQLAAVLGSMPNPDPEPREGDLRGLEQRLVLAAGGKLSVYKIDRSTGGLEPHQSLTLNGAGPFTFAPSRRLLYAVCEIAEKGQAFPAIATVSIDADGKLEFVNRARVNHRPGYLMCDNNGEFLAGSHYGPGKASVWKLEPEFRGQLVEELQLEKNAHSSVFSPDNHWLLVPATGPNKIFVNRFTAQVGQAEPSTPPFVHGSSSRLEARQPRHLVFHPNLSIAYTSNEREQPGIAVWAWDTEIGVLAPVQNLLTQPVDFQGKITTADLHLTPNAKFLYLSNRDVTQPNSEIGRDAIVGFEVDPQSGKLTSLGQFPCERIPRSFAIDRLGGFLYVAGQGDDRLGIYRIENSGKLTKVDQLKVGRKPSWVAAISIPKSNSVGEFNDSTKETPEFLATQQEEFVSADSKLELLWGDGVFTEGPTVAPNGCVLFTDVRQQRVMQYNPRTNRTSIFREESGGANGLAHDQVGRLLACEGADGGGRRISLTEIDGQVKTLVDRWQGKRLNSPNDITIAPNGSVYFTDPRYRGDEVRELDFEGVFLVQDGEAILATKEVERPNGLAISPDGRRAYVADNNNAPGGARKLYAFDILSDGTFSNRKELFSFSEAQRGIDGMTLDKEGNIFATAGKGARAGVYVFSPEGKQLAVITVPDVPTNCTFANDQCEVLYITAQVPNTSGGKPSFGLYRIRLR